MITPRSLFQQLIQNSRFNAIAGELAEGAMVALVKATPVGWIATILLVGALAFGLMKSDNYIDHTFFQ